MSVRLVTVVVCAAAAVTVTAGQEPSHALLDRAKAIGHNAELPALRATKRSVRVERHITKRGNNDGNDDGSETA